MAGEESVTPMLPAGKQGAIDVVPSSIGAYTIDSLLERGGMSVLYLAIHAQTKMPLAIKVLAKKFINNPAAVARFLHEGEILMQLDHAYIVKVYQYGQWECGYYLAMEFIQGLSLRQYILQQPMSLKHAIELIIDIAYALCHIHVRGIIHRDLKPENILIDEEGKIKLIDFGIARSLLAKEPMTAQPLVIGTPVYMSPEQRNDPHTAYYPSDVYSLGLIAYEMILGRLSHGKVSVSLLPRGLQPIISRALQPDPGQRYQDVVDFIADLSAYLTSPLLARELRAGDKLSELSEQISLASRWLTPAKLPQSEAIESGVALKCDGPAGGIWYDIIEAGTSRLWLFLGETATEGIAGMCDAAALRALAHATTPQVASPSERITFLQGLANGCLLRPPRLLLCATCDKSCWQWDGTIAGLGSAWLLKAAPFALERLAPVQDADGLASFSIPWDIGDLILFASDPIDDSSNLFSYKEWEKALHAYHDLSTQKLVENTLRRLKNSAKEQWPSRGLTLLALRRIC